MSDLRFACPHCGQRISGDSAYKGTQIQCPACKQTITVPAPAPRAPVVPGTKPAAVQPAPEPGERERSPLALVSLVCSLGIGIGSIPGIIFGHLARSRIKRNPAVRGKGMATAALIISYCFLISSITFVALGAFVLGPPRGHQLTRKEQEANTPTALAARLVDEVKINNSESESAHQLKDLRSTTGRFMNRDFRDAYSGGVISYLMKVDPARPVSLCCTYWGNDTGGRHFDVLVNDVVIGKQTLDFNDPGHFFEVAYPIPEKLTRGQTNVTVTFQGYPGKTVGGIFGLQMLTR